MTEPVARDDWRRRFISDTFHTLAQPLTALHLSLELALMKDDPACRTTVAEALAATRRLISTTTFLRESAYAEDPGEPIKMEVGSLLQKVVDELAPVAEAGGIRLETCIDSRMEVFADAAKLEQALFLLMNESFSGVREQGTLKVSASPAGACATVSIRGMQADGFGAASQALQIASKMFRAASGELECRLENGAGWIDARLPLCVGEKTLSAVPEKTLINK